MSKEIHIHDAILTLRNSQVTLDRDLANIFGVETKVLNQAVKRNVNRFPAKFMFQLTPDELQYWKSQNVTSNGDKMGWRKLPFAFTEHGVAMLTTVLKSDTAAQVSLAIIAVFVLFRNSVLANPKIENRFNVIESQLNEQKKKLDLLYDKTPFTQQPEQGIFFNDQLFDAYVFASNLITSAKKSIVLIDNYIDETTLLQLSKRNASVKCVIYTEKISPQLKLDWAKHNAQYPPIEIRTIKKVHDRFLIIDNQSLYHIGASLKDLGKRWFAFSRMDGILEDVMKRLP
jgi:ORF6N domain